MNDHSEPMNESMNEQTKEGMACLIDIEQKNSISK